MCVGVCVCLNEFVDKKLHRTLNLLLDLKSARLGWKSILEREINYSKITQPVQNIYLKQLVKRERKGKNTDGSLIRKDTHT